ncbi:hypothetical protein EDD21DRAFT_428164 [Dissophora ornata]|nr:hypothetical protein EDD21DRAFT_428164 [Dissophora ornata]
MPAVPKTPTLRHRPSTLLHPPRVRSPRVRSPLGRQRSVSPDRQSTASPEPVVPDPAAPSPVVPGPVIPGPDAPVPGSDAPVPGPDVVPSPFIPGPRPVLIVPALFLSSPFLVPWSLPPSNSIRLIESRLDTLYGQIVLAENVLERHRFAPNRAEFVASHARMLEESRQLRRELIILTALHQLE